MAKTPVNSGLKTLRGELDGWVYRNLLGATVIARPPQPSTKPPTEEQVNVRERFRRAALYARAVFADPVRKARYTTLAVQRGTHPSRVFGFVVQDYAKPPVVSEVNLTGFARRLGDSIRVYATDEGEVTEVTVTLKTDDGTVLETGPAVVTDATWQYAVKAAYPDEGPLTVIVTAKDLPGNVAVKSVVAA